MSVIDEQYLTKLYNDLHADKQKVFLEINNDKELQHERELNQKLNVIDSIIKNVIKYRNLKIKDKLKFTL
jgi:hypothetical protein